MIKTYRANSSKKKVQSNRKLTKACSKINYSDFSAYVEYVSELVYAQKGNTNNLSKKKRHTQKNIFCAY